jgi:hypothetical protein
MTVAMTTVHVHAVSAAMSAMPTAVTTASRSRGDSSSGQSDRGDSCERNLAKHICSLHVRGVIA